MLRALNVKDSRERGFGRTIDDTYRRGKLFIISIIMRIDLTQGVGFEGIRWK